MLIKDEKYKIRLLGATLFLLIAGTLFFWRLLGDGPYEMKLAHKIEASLSPDIVTCKGDTFHLPNGYAYQNSENEDDGICLLKCTAEPNEYLSIFYSIRNLKNEDILSLINRDYNGIVRGTLIKKSYVFLSGSDTLYSTLTSDNVKQYLGIRFIPYYITFYVSNSPIVFDFIGSRYDLNECIEALKTILYNDPNRPIEYNQELTNKLNL